MSNPEIDKFGNQYWYNEKRVLHREDGPAIEFINGEKRWYINGDYHRIDGPAVIMLNLVEHYFLYDKKYSKEDFLKHPEVITYQKLKELL